MVVACVRRGNSNVETKIMRFVGAIMMFGGIKV